MGVWWLVSKKIPEIWSHFLLSSFLQLFKCTTLVLDFFLIVFLEALSRGWRGNDPCPHDKKNFTLKWTFYWKEHAVLPSPHANPTCLQAYNITRWCISHNFWIHLEIIKQLTKVLPIKPNNIIAACIVYLPFELYLICSGV